MNPVTDTRRRDLTTFSCPTDVFKPSHIPLGTATQVTKLRLPIRVPPITGTQPRITPQLHTMNLHLSTMPPSLLITDDELSVYCLFIIYLQSSYISAMSTVLIQK